MRRTAALAKGSKAIVAAVIPASTRLRAVYANPAEALARGLGERGLSPTVELRGALDIDARNDGFIGSFTVADYLAMPESMSAGTRITNTRS